MVMLRSFWAVMPNPWLPPLSDILISFAPAPPGLDELLSEPDADAPGSP